MRYDEYIDLYHTDDDEWYYQYVDEELKKIRRRYNESKRINQRNK